MKRGRPKQIRQSRHKPNRLFSQRLSRRKHQQSPSPAKLKAQSTPRNDCEDGKKNVKTRKLLWMNISQNKRLSWIGWPSS